MRHKPTAREARGISIRLTRSQTNLRRNQDREKLLAYIDHTEKRIEELEEALKLTQFGFNHRRCPVCAGWNMSENGETDGAHTKECPVGMALAIAEERKDAKAAPYEWEYYEKGYRVRISSDRFQRWSDDEFEWMDMRPSQDIIEEIRSESNGWKRVEGREG